MEKEKILSTVEEIRGISDPYRHRILSCFQAFGQPATVKQVADRIGEVPAKVYYHVKKMVAVGILVLHHTQEINGIVAKFYEPTAQSFRIRHADSSGTSKAAFLDETQQFISKTYENSRDLLLSTIEKQRDSAQKVSATLSTQDIYLTKAQADQLSAYIEALAEENKMPGEDKKRFHYFFSIFSLE